MSDPFEEALAQAEAEEAKTHASTMARQADEEAKIEARHNALRARLDALKTVVLKKQTVLESRGFQVQESIDNQRLDYAVLLAGGRKRIAIHLKGSNAFKLHVYWHGMRDEDGWQTVIHSEDATTYDQVMAILGEWIVRYGQTEIR